MELAGVVDTVAVVAPEPAAAAAVPPAAAAAVVASAAAAAVVSASAECARQEKYKGCERTNNPCIQHSFIHMVLLRDYMRKISTFSCRHCIALLHTCITYVHLIRR